MFYSVGREKTGEKTEVNIDWSVQLFPRVFPQDWGDEFNFGSSDNGKKIEYFPTKDFFDSFLFGIKTKGFLFKRCWTKEIFVIII